MRPNRLIGPLGMALALLPVASRAQAPVTDASPYSPKVSAASDEGTRAIAKFKVPEGFKVELFAAEPLLANPVAFALDEQEPRVCRRDVPAARGRHRHPRAHGLARRRPRLAHDADRLAMYRKHLGKDYDTYGVEHDRVRLLEDTDGDGKADRSTVFADGFKRHEDGIGAGLLASGRRRLVHLHPRPLAAAATRDGDGMADDRKSLQAGYGVHVGFLGPRPARPAVRARRQALFQHRRPRPERHDARGRRSSTSTPARSCAATPTASKLEIFATGLRNPQELAFDDHGNLFTGDNNSDSGDKARWVHVVEGGDSGWRIGYQFIEAPRQPGPLERREALAPALGRPGRLHRPADRQHRRRPLGPDATTPAPACPTAIATTSSCATSAAAPAGRAASAPSREAEGGVVRAGRLAGVLLVRPRHRRRLRHRRRAYTSPTGSKAGTCPARAASTRFTTPNSRRTRPSWRSSAPRRGHGQRPPEELASCSRTPISRVRQEAQFALAAKGKCGHRDACRGGQGRFVAARPPACDLGPGPGRAGCRRGTRPAAIPRWPTPTRRSAPGGAGDLRRGSRPQGRARSGSSPSSATPPRVRMFAAIGLGKLGPHSEASSRSSRCSARTAATRPCGTPPSWAWWSRDLDDLIEAESRCVAPGPDGRPAGHAAQGAVAGRRLPRRRRPGHRPGGRPRHQRRTRRRRRCRISPRCSTARPGLPEPC